MNVLHRICDNNNVSITFFVQTLVRIEYGMRFGLDALTPAKHELR